MKKTILESEISDLLKAAFDPQLAAQILTGIDYHFENTLLKEDEDGEVTLALEEDHAVRGTVACMAVIVGFCENKELGVRMLEEMYEMRKDLCDYHSEYGHLPPFLTKEPVH